MSKEKLPNAVLKPSWKNQREEEEEEEEDSEQIFEESCRTPTSSDHKIPAIQSCPPTPRKKVIKLSSRSSSFHNKRKVSDDGDRSLFFEATRRDEVESFFISNSRAVKNKRCKSF